MKLAAGIILTVVSATYLSAQSYGVSDAERVAASIEARFAAWDRERHEANSFAEKRFIRRASDFVRKWNEFVDKYNQGQLDIRAARELSQAFHQMEKTPCWPRPKSLEKNAARPSGKPE